MCDCRYDDTFDRIEYCAKHDAAPELLKALRTIRDRLTNGPRHNASDKAMRLIHAVANEAIAKAEGRQP